MILWLLVETGLDVLVREGFRPLRDRRVGLVTNRAATVDALHGRVRLTALFSPEHGIRADADAPVDSGRDERTGLPIRSLYGKTKKPTAEMLRDVDVLVFDIQDVGARFYTYITTLALVMEAAREHGKKVVVLDRPNPVGGEAVEGPILEEALRGGFASYAALPTRHGLTIGEFALWQNPGCDLEVVKMTGWRRSMYWDETGLPWTNPSPNLRSLEAAISYPGLGCLEATNLSVGRGTEKPFVWYGAPWIDEKRLCAELDLPGVRFKPATFTPRLQKGLPKYPHTDALCRGFEVEITDRRAYRPVLAALHVLRALHRLHPKEFSFGNSCGMIGVRSIRQDLESGKSPEEIEKSWNREAYLKSRERILLYR